MAEFKDGSNYKRLEMEAAYSMPDEEERMDLIPWNIASEFRTKLMTLWNSRHIGTESFDGEYRIRGPEYSIQGVLEAMIKMDDILNPDPDSEDAKTYIETRVAMKNCFLEMAAVFAAYNYNGGHANIQYDDDIGGKEFVNDIFAITMLEVSKYYGSSACKYEDNTWRKDIPIKVYFSSACQHFMKWINRWKDEPHDRAVIWNCLCGAWEAGQECTEWAIRNAKEPKQH